MSAHCRVEYFAACLDGYTFTQHAWVQSYGSRYVRPPIIHGDIKRATAMTIREFKVAQAITHLPVKGMLTGPVTMLNWSFPRSDIPRSVSAFQLALAIREEVVDLEKAGCTIIQVRASSSTCATYSERSCTKLHEAVCGRIRQISGVNT